MSERSGENCVTQWRTVAKLWCIKLRSFLWNTR